MLFRGTKEYSRENILKVLSHKNTQFNGFTNYENLVLQSRCLEENFRSVSDTFLSMVTSSVFNQSDIEDETKVISSEFKEYKSDASFHLRNSVQNFRWNLNDILVDPNSIPISVEDLCLRTKEIWDPSRIVIYVTSSLSHKAILDVVSNWETVKSNKEVKSIECLTYENNGTVPYEKIDFPVGNSLIVVGEIPNNLSVREGIITKIISSVYSNGFSGRLMKKLRNERSLVYGTGLGFSLSKLHNTLNFCADSKPEDYLEIYQVFLNLISAPIKLEEFNLVKEDLIASSVFSSEDLSSSHARMISGYMNYGFVYPEDYIFSHLNSISLEEVINFQQKLFCPKTFSVHVLNNG